MAEEVPLVLETSQVVGAKEAQFVFATLQFAVLEINLDRLLKPALGYFIEVKRTTWNRQVAEEAAPLIGKLLHLLEVSAVDVRQRAYVDLAASIAHDYYHSTPII